MSMVVVVNPPPPAELARLKNELISYGWSIIQSSIERPVGDILEGSELLLGCPLVVIGVPTEAEASDYYARITVRDRGRFHYKVATD